MRAGEKRNAWPSSQREQGSAFHPAQGLYNFIGDTTAALPTRPLSHADPHG